MNWYIAKVVMKITSDKTAHAPQFDEQLRLLQASSAEEAFIKARTIGIGEEETLQGSGNQQVKWEFINVAEIVPVRTLSDGAEIYSSIHEPAEDDRYVQLIHEKAIFIRKSQLIR